jgi:hypothetical protein
MRGISEGFGTGGPDAVAPALLDMLLGKPEIHHDWLQAGVSSLSSGWPTRWPCSWVSMTSPAALGSSLSQP